MLLYLCPLNLAMLLRIVVDIVSSDSRLTIRPPVRLSVCLPITHRWSTYLLWFCTERYRTMW